MTITVNGATNTITAASGLTVAGNTAVTGTLSATGDVTFTGATNGILNVNATGTNFTRLSFQNDGGQYFFGANDSTGSGFGGTAYAQVIYAPAGRVVETSIAGTGVITKVSSTGLAVTGALSATGAIQNNSLSEINYRYNGPINFIGGDTTGNGFLTLVSSTTGLGYVSFADGTTGTNRYSGLIEYDHSSDTMSRRTAGVVRETLSATGLSLIGLLDLSNASSGQIKFPATQNASADANTLDDYEEGTWTPTDGSGAALSLTGTDCKYTKVGRLVTVVGLVSYPATASGSNALINGLPFTPASQRSAGATMNNASINIVTYVVGGTAGVYLFNAETETAVTNAQASGKNFTFSHTYFV